jgi:hypothetical protein
LSEYAWVKRQTNPKGASCEIGLAKQKHEGESKGNKNVDEQQDKADLFIN